MKVLKPAIVPAVLVAALCCHGVAFAKKGADDKPGLSGGVADDKGGTRPAGVSDDPPGDDKGGLRGGVSTSVNGSRRLRLSLGNGGSAGSIRNGFEYRADGRGARFKGTMKLRLDGSVPGLDSRPAAEDALITATLARGGVT